MSLETTRRETKRKSEGYANAQLVRPLRDDFVPNMADHQSMLCDGSKRRLCLFSTDPYSFADLPSFRFPPPDSALCRFLSVCRREVYAATSLRMFYSDLQQVSKWR
jgi:hypothetical protein